MAKKENGLRENLKGRVALVTGGTRGIGFAIAQSLLEEELKVAICGRSQKSLDRAFQILSPMGEVYGVTADMGKRSDVERFVSDAYRHFGTVDILVNNAAIGTFQSVAELSPEQWDEMIALNLSGPYYSAHAVLPIFKQQGRGDVINISSLAGKNPFAGGAGYNASKFGLNGFSEAMMLDHRDEGVRVSYVMPGSVDTEFGTGRSSGIQNGIERKADWKIAPEDIADIVLLLLRMPRRSAITRVEIRPSKPPQKG